MSNGHDRLRRALASSALVATCLSQTGCAAMSDRFGLLDPIDPAAEKGKVEGKGGYRDEYGMFHSYSDQSGSERPFDDYKSSGGNKPGVLKQLPLFD